MIENKIASSGLVNLDLSDFKPKFPIVGLDIAPWLWEGIALKETLFKEFLENHNWAQYSQKNVALFCSQDAIIPNWAYMLIVVKLKDIAVASFLGSLKDFNTFLYLSTIDEMPLGEYIDKRVLIKGCGDVPAQAFVAAAQKLTPVVKSLMFGEACSNVPLYKNN